MNPIRDPFFDVFAFLALTVRRLALAAVTAFALLHGQSHAMSFKFVAPVLYPGSSVVPYDWAAWQKPWSVSGRKSKPSYAPTAGSSGEK